MIERGEIGPPDRWDWEKYQYQATASFALRKQIYEYARPLRGGEKFPDIYEETIEKLQLAGDESVLDIGFGDNKFLTKLRQRYNHQGKLYGVDNENIVREEKLRSGEIHNIELFAGYAESLDFDENHFDDNSLDVVSGFFMLYHTNVDKALSEIHRVLKPGGKVAVATSSALNKYRQREFERIIADELNIYPPPTYNEQFDSFSAEGRLSQYFEKSETPIAHLGRIPINYDNMDKYIDSIVSMKQTFHPNPKYSDLTRVIENKVLPIIEAQIDKNGEFIEYVHRTVHFCGKP